MVVHSRIDRRKVLLSTALYFQIFINYHYYFAPLYYIGTTISFIYKDTSLYYPGNLLGWECSVFVFLFVIDMVRLYLGEKANRSARASMLIVFLVLCIPAIVGYVFFFTLQTYIHLFDKIVGVAGLVLTCMEVGYGVATMTAYRNIKAEQQQLVDGK